MTKRFLPLPNERVLIVDWEAATSELAQGLANLHNSLIFEDKFARVLDGFRVEITDQTVAPGQFTVHNGRALDRDGQLVTNETDVDASRSLTLGANATYYVEVEFVISASDVDARPFWDPTYSNGADPSGDVRPPGREVSVNVSTRLTPD